MSIAVSPISRTFPIWRYVFPLQSGSQAVSCGLTMVVGLIGVFAVLRLFDPAEPTLAVLLGALGGGSATLYGVLPGRMKVLTPGASAQAAEIIHRYLVKSSYRVIEPGAGCYRYTSSGPRLLQWRENNLTVRVSGEAELCIEGPLVGLAQLRIVLMRD
jgi:xanthosine utilization system XapX-like protein